MIRLDIMKKGEKFIGINGNQIMLKTKTGEIRIVTIRQDEEGVWIDDKMEMLIGFGNGEITVGDMDEDIEVTMF